jgi:biotin operon repressor
VDVYRCLDRHLKKKNGIYPGDDVIAQECGISSTDVQSCIEKLHQIGFITEEPIK